MQRHVLAAALLASLLGGPSSAFGQSALQSRGNAVITAPSRLGPSLPAPTISPGVGMATGTGLSPSPPVTTFNPSHRQHPPARVYSPGVGVGVVPQPQHSQQWQRPHAPHGHQQHGLQQPSHQYHGHQQQGHQNNGHQHHGHQRHGPRFHNSPPVIVGAPVVPYHAPPAVVYYNYSSSPATVVQSAPLPSGPTQEARYYCRDYREFYPQVETCPSNWLIVLGEAPVE